ncbi:DUF2294 domain-containing protein [Kamptonema formosum]|uniref:DUF2294 domain-containing protein n=1 Tax=Kamptonema formosum TaxID=331992 RepID=UPI0003468693|nr:DUF2294 domain-containing protein [Oscillatoria sp. PCC 10802]
MTGEKSLPTRGQLERTISQRLGALYRSEIGHQPSKIDCRLVEEKVTVVLENSITKAELLLAESGQEELAERFRDELQQLIEPKIKALIEEILETPVIDVLTHAKLETGRTGTIVLLAAPPQVRPPSSGEPVRRETAED